MQQKVDNSMERGLLMGKKLMNPDGTLNGYQIQALAIKESIIFYGALLEAGNDKAGIDAVFDYIMAEALKKNLMEVHSYVQKIYKEITKHKELEGFYAASLDWDTLYYFAHYFWLSLSELSDKTGDKLLAILLDELDNRHSWNSLSDDERMGEFIALLKDPDPLCFETMNDEEDDENESEE